MLRFIMWLFGKEYDSCKTCIALREQLQHEREIQKEMFRAYNDFVQPKPAVTHTFQPPAGMVAAKPFILPSKMKHELERVDRERARQEATSIHLAQPDASTKSPQVPREAIQDIDKLEKELGLDEETEDASRSNHSNG